MKRYLLLFTLLIVSVQFKAQLSVTMSHRQSTMNVSSSVPIIVASPGKDGFSTKELSEAFPASKIPVEVIRVKYPVITGAVDTAGIIWSLKPESYSPRGEINIVLVTIDQDSIKRYYIDNNNDRIFGESEQSFVFRPDEESKSVEIQIMGSPYRYTLMNPDYKPLEKTPSRIKEFSSKWLSAARKVSLNMDISLITGGGDAKITFVPTGESIDLYQYQAQLVGSLRPSLGLGVSWFHFNFVAFGAYERLQYDETVLYKFSDNIKGGKMRYYERSTWPTSRLYYGFSAEYDIKISSFYLSPTVAYTWFSNINEVKLDKTIAVAPDAHYKNMHSKEFGGKFKVPVSDRTLLYIKYIYSTIWFDASDYIVPYVEGTYNVDYKQNYFGMGIQVRLTR